jgi:hypothetical protein
MAPGLSRKAAVDIDTFGVEKPRVISAACGAQCSDSPARGTAWRPLRTDLTASLPRRCTARWADANTGPRPRTPVSQRTLLIEGMLVVTQPVTPPRPALSSVGVRETAMRRLASVRETSVRHNVTGSFEPGISSGCFVTHQIRRK